MLSSTLLSEQLCKKPRFNDDRCRRRATKAKKIGLQRLKEIAAIATPRTCLTGPDAGIWPSCPFLLPDTTVVEPPVRRAVPAGAEGDRILQVDRVVTPMEIEGESVSLQA